MPLRLGNKRPVVIRLDARLTTSSDLILIEVEIRRAGELVLVTTNLEEARIMLEQLGVDDPLNLLKAASRWGAAEIREEPNPKWRGG